VSLANLGDLQTAIAEWLYRKTDANLNLRANDLIALFEADFTIDSENRTFEMEEVDTTAISASTVPLPDGFIDMIRLQATNQPNGVPNAVLDYVSPNRAAELDSSAAAPAASQAVARNYTTLAGNIVIVPQRWAPIGGTLELAYYSFTPLAQAPGGVNWLMKKYPNLYLYGALMHAAAYVDDKETVVFWKSGRDEAMAKLQKSERKRKLGAAPLTITSSIGFRR
jgi:hypothetical protein